MALLLKDIDPQALTPMMQQYLELKLARPDCLLLFRLGDFYELFFDDALIVSEALGLTLTQRDCGLPERAPMCGVPHHAIDTYLKRLLDQQFKVAICEQLEDPQLAKGLVKRGISRIVTPGTLSEAENLDSQTYRYLCSVFQLDRYFALAACDLSCGLFETCEILYGDTEQKLVDELARFNVAELICNEAFHAGAFGKRFLAQQKIAYTVLPETLFSKEQVNLYPALQAEEEGLWQRASAVLLAYLADTQQQEPTQWSAIRPYQIEAFMLLDANARKNLELTETISEQKKQGSLLWAIDRCKTSMGSRLLKHWMEHPLLSIAKISERQDAVRFFLERFLLRQNLREALRGLYDLERLAGKLALSTCNARDLKALQGLLERLPGIRALLVEAEADPALAGLLTDLGEHGDIAELLGRALLDDLPLSVKEGGLIRPGYSEALDHLHDLTQNGRQWLLDLEQREREETGIRNLKLRYNRVFGYTIEVSKSQLELVPERYIRRQTLANGERFITEELKQREQEILGAESRQVLLEYDLFCELREQVEARRVELQRLAAALARLDVLSALAELAEREHYCRPQLLTEPLLRLVGARHPVVEQRLKEQRFVPNDLELNAEQHLMLLTGPNMSGKSTYMRQTALIAILAQMGSYVPADACTLGLCDRVFTRVGASDDLGAGKSTFMVEMSELAEILKEAGPGSLLILDEIGRGTSTYDGLALAWSVIEYLLRPEMKGTRILFATHYHELIDLEHKLPGLFNAHIEVRAEKGEIRFLHQIRPGGTDDSYGIDVAKLAGVPMQVVNRARDILHWLEQENAGKKRIVKRQAKVLDQQQDLLSMSHALRAKDEIWEALKALDLNTLRPIDALALLADLQSKIKEA